jgi:hypothetical protein
MRQIFVQTANVSAFVNAMNDIVAAPADADKMVLVTGSAGRGKTRTAIWYAATSGALYLRAKYYWRGNFRMVLREIIWECGQKPAYRTDLMAEQVIEALRAHGKPLLIDEADYLDQGSIKTIRDIHDLSRVPVVFLGVSHIARAVLQDQAVWRRFAHNIVFRDLTPDEVPAILRQLCEVPLSDDAIDVISQNCKMMADVIRYIHHAERAWRGRTAQMPGSVVKGFKPRVLQGRGAA